MSLPWKCQPPKREFVLFKDYSCYIFSSFILKIIKIYWLNLLKTNFYCHFLMQNFKGLYINHLWFRQQWAISTHGILHEFATTRCKCNILTQSSTSVWFNQKKKLITKFWNFWNAKFKIQHNDAQKVTMYVYVNLQPLGLSATFYKIIINMSQWCEKLIMKF